MKLAPASFAALYLVLSIAAARAVATAEHPQQHGRALAQAPPPFLSSVRQFIVDLIQNTRENKNEAIAKEIATAVTGRWPEYTVVTAVLDDWGLANDQASHFGVSVYSYCDNNPSPPPDCNDVGAKVGYYAPHQTTNTRSWVLFWAKQSLGNLKDPLTLDQKTRDADAACQFSKGLDNLPVYAKCVADTASRLGALVYFPGTETAGYYRDYAPTTISTWTIMNPNDGPDLYVFTLPARFDFTN